MNPSSDRPQLPAQPQPPFDSPKPEHLLSSLPSDIMSSAHQTPLDRLTKGTARAERAASVIGASILEASLNQESMNSVNSGQPPEVTDALLLEAAQARNVKEQKIVDFDAAEIASANNNAERRKSLGKLSGLAYEIGVVNSLTDRPTHMSVEDEAGVLVFDISDQKSRPNDGLSGLSISTQDKDGSLLKSFVFRGIDKTSGKILIEQYDNESSTLIRDDSPAYKRIMDMLSVLQEARDYTVQDDRRPRVVYGNRAAASINEASLMKAEIKSLQNRPDQGLRIEYIDINGDAAMPGATDRKITTTQPKASDNPLGTELSDIYGKISRYRSS